MEPCKNHPDTGAESECRICAAPCCGECISRRTGICHDCVMKGVAILMVIMVIVSYTIWFGLF